MLGVWVLGDVELFKDAWDLPVGTLNWNDVLLGDVEVFKGAGCIGSIRDGGWIGVFWGVELFKGE